MLPGSIKDMGLFRSYGRLLASRGVAAVTFAYPFATLADLPRATAHVEKAVEFVRERASQYNIDPDRLCLWVVSAGGVVVAPLLTPARTYLRCLLFYYSVVAPSGFEDAWPEGVDVASHTVTTAITRRGSAFPPILIARASADAPSLNQTLDALLSEALRNNVMVDFLGLPHAQHGFDVLDDTPRSREVIEHSLGFIRRHLIVASVTP